MNKKIEEIENNSLILVDNDGGSLGFVHIDVEDYNYLIERARYANRMDTAVMSLKRILAVQDD